jgi:hypothetical protein
MQDSPERGNNGVLRDQKGSLPDLVLGHQVYSRHLGFPAVSPVGSGIAGRLAWFGAEDRLPLARSVLQRWSASGGACQSLPSLQWLNSFTSGRKTTAACAMPRRVAKISPLSEATVDTAVAGETSSSLPSDPTSSAVRAVSRSSSGNSTPARVTMNSRIERQETPIVHSVSERTANGNETASEKPSASTIQASVDAARSVAKRAEVAGTGVADSRTDTAAPAGLVGGASTSTAAAMQSSTGSAGTPVFRSTSEKSRSAGKGKVRSTIVEAVQRRGFGGSTYGAGEPHGKTGTSSTSMPLGRSTHFPIETASGNAGSSKLTKEATRKEAKEKELTHVDPAAQSGEPAMRMTADPRLGAEGPASILRVTEPALAGATFVGPPIFRRSVGGQARTALPADGFRSPDTLPNSGMPAAHAPRAFHTVNRKESTEFHGEDRQSASQTAMQVQTPSVELARELPKRGTDGTDIKSTFVGGQSVSPKLKPPSIVDSNSALRLRVGEPFEAVFTEPAAAAHSKPIYKASSSNKVSSAINKSAGIDAVATHFSKVSRVPSVGGGIERSTESTVIGGEVGGAAQITHTVARLPRSQGEAGNNSSVRIPSMIHAQLSLDPENSQSAAVGNKTSCPELQVQSSPRSASTQPTIARATDALPVATSPEGSLTSASSRASSLQNPGSALTPVFLDSGSPPGQKLHDSKTTDQVEARTNSGQGKAEVQTSASDPTVALFPLEGGSSQAVAHAVHPDQPTSDSPSLTHLAPGISLSASSANSAITQGPSSTSAAIIETTTNTMADVSPQIEKSERSAGNSSAVFTNAVWRSVESESQKVEQGNTPRELQTAGDDTIRRDPVKVAQSSSTHPRAAITLGHRPLAARRTETSMLRQSAVPAGLPRLSGSSTVSGSHPLASLSASENVHRSSATMLKSVTSSVRSSTLTHRVVPTINRLQSVPESYPAGISSGMNVAGSYPLVARAAGSATGVPASNTSTTPSLPAVTNQSSNTFQGLKKAEMTQLANRVYDLLVQRLASERQRRGQ